MAKTKDFFCQKAFFAKIFFLRKNAFAQKNRKKLPGEIAKTARGAREKGFVVFFVENPEELPKSETSTS